MKALLAKILRRKPEAAPATTTQPQNEEGPPAAPALTPEVARVILLRDVARRDVEQVKVILSVLNPAVPEDVKMVLTALSSACDYEGDAPVMSLLVRWLLRIKETRVLTDVLHACLRRASKRGAKRQVHALLEHAPSFFPVEVVERCAHSALHDGVVAHRQIAELLNSHASALRAAPRTAS